MDARRHLRRQRDHRSDLRRGRRRRGAALAVPRHAAQALRQGRGPGRSSTTSPSSTTPTRRRRSRKAFPYGKAIGVGKGNAVLDAGSFKPVGPKGARPRRERHPRWASNFLLVGASRSATGHPLFVGGPQIGYTYPGLTLEADISYPGVQARGATRPGFAGNILIGRGQDFAWSLTSAGSDLIDNYVETLCGGSKTKYRYKGKCRKMGTVDAGTIEGRAREVQHHGPRPGHGLREGRRQDASRSRASGRATARTSSGSSPFRDLTTGKVKSATTLARRDGDLAVHVQRRLRGRPRHRHVLGRPAAASATRGSTRACPPRAPASTSGRASSARRQHPFQVNPPSGTLVNWNNRPAPKWGAADDNWSYGSAAARADAQRRPGQGADAHARDGHLRDERGGDAGPAQRRADAGDHRAAEAARRRRRRGRRGCWRSSTSGARRARHGSTATSTAGSTPAPARRSGTRSIRGCSRRRCRSRASARTSAPMPAPRATSPTAASGTSRRTCARSTAKGRRAVQHAVLRRRQPGEVRRGGLEGARRRAGRPRTR